jgi:hypothetical protein
MDATAFDLPAAREYAMVCIKKGPLVGPFYGTFLWSIRCTETAFSPPSRGASSELEIVSLLGLVDDESLTQARQCSGWLPELGLNGT